MIELEALCVAAWPSSLASADRLPSWMGAARNADSAAVAGRLGVTVLFLPDDVFWHARSGSVPLSRAAQRSLVYRALPGYGTRAIGMPSCWPRRGGWFDLGALPWVLLLVALAGLAFVGLAVRPAGPHDLTPFGAFLAASIWLLWLCCPMLRLP
jgi:hypothetical protein